jgi:hypothetical protein
MANYYAFTKNGKPVLGSPIQGAKPRGGKTVPVIPAKELNVLLSTAYTNENYTEFADVDSWKLQFTIDNDSPWNHEVVIGWVYTGERLTAKTLLESVNKVASHIGEFKLVNNELHLVKSYIGKIASAWLILTLD